MTIYIWHFLLQSISFRTVPDGFLLAFFAVADFGARGAGEVEEEGGLDSSVDGHVRGIYGVVTVVGIVVTLIVLSVCIV